MNKLLLLGLLQVVLVPQFSPGPLGPANPGYDPRPFYQQQMAPQYTPLPPLPPVNSAPVAPIMPSQQSRPMNCFSNVIGGTTFTNCY
jgi:hypothetical protein